MIYLVEDDDNIRKLVCYALGKEGLETEGFSVPLEFWKAIGKAKPELILLDIMLPGEDGLSILAKLKAAPETEDIPVIMLTAKSSEYDKVTGLDSGADDYIAKPFGMTELVSRVRAVLRRYNKAKGRKMIYDVCELHVDLERHTVMVNDSEVILSYKEFSLLEALLEAEGRVVRRGELLTKVWGEFYDESRTLDVHIRKLRVKLGSAGTHIKTVKNMGYKIGDDVNE
ncbi:MAG: response regulator transcription factor [Clostridia bacterium]|nr:response regulator transcription factor [Clostridia bacterium]